SAEQQFDVTNVLPSAPTSLALSTSLIAGMHSIRLSSVYMYDSKNPNAAYDRTAYVGNIRLDAVPLASAGIAPSAIVDCGGAALSSDECATHVLATFLPRAWRRPVTGSEIANVKAVSDSI